MCSSDLLCCPGFEPYPDEIPDVKLNIRDEKISESYSDQIKELLNKDLFSDIEEPINMEEENDE